MDTGYSIRPELFLRAPFYSFRTYDPGKLPGVLQDDYFREAIRLASPVFYRVLENRSFEPARLSEKERHTLHKYYNRMCFRPTPFGSFASFTLCGWGDGSPLRLAGPGDGLLHMLPDLPDSAGAFRPGAAAEEDTLLIANPTLYRLGSALRFVRTEAGEKGRYRFGIDQADAVRFNLQLLKQLDQGPVRAERMRTWIAERAGCTAEEAGDYLRFLVEEQVLYTPEQGYVTGAPDGPDPERSTRAPGRPELAGKTVYAALERPAFGGGPGEADREELLRVTGILARLSAGRQAEDLERFIRDFKKRFDLQKVPLLLALDPDAGIPYGQTAQSANDSGPLRGLPFPESGDAAALLPWEGARQLFLRLWLENGGRSPGDPIRVRESDLAGMAAGTGELPDTLAVMFRKAGDGLLLESASGASATQLIGRFSLFSDPVHDLCLELAAHEQAQRPGALLAEIGMLSDQHVDNINRRRMIYPREIPLNTYSRISPAQQLALCDLLLSVRDDELVLEDARTGKRVFPRLPTAFNYRRNELALFRLLCDLQYQGLRADLGFDLARLFPGMNYYPRVVCGRTIIGLATWYLDQAELDGLRRGSDNLDAFRERRGLPRLVRMGSSDQQLVFDLGDPEGSAFFLACLAHKSAVYLQEYLSSDSSVHTEEGPLAGQYIAFLTRQMKETQGASPHYPAGKRGRQFVPGSDWLYLKFYCSPAGANTLLEKMVIPVISRYDREIACWFFVRYTDPEFHLRVRVRFRDPAGVAGLLIAFRDRLKKAGAGELVRDMIVDTYQRELERYGPRYIRQAEAVFHAGSVWFGSRLTADPFGTALVTAWRMIRCFFEGREADRFAALMSDSLLQEFRADKPLRVALDRKYRDLRPAILEMLGADQDGRQDDGLFAETRRMAAMMAGENGQRKRRMLADLVHMQLNRTFAERQRQQEMFVYYCLHKFRVAVRARLKKADQPG